MSRKVSLCLMPELSMHFQMNDSIAVVMDVLRATSCIVTGIEGGAAHFIPTLQPEQAKTYQDKGYLAAGERGGEKVEGFDLGNSPLEYLDAELHGKKIAITTTNGTRAIEAAKSARICLIASFANFSKTIDFLNNSDRDVILVCSGWKGSLSMEDTLLGGALIHHLQSCSCDGDEALAAKQLFLSVKNNLLAFVKTSSHAQRLIKLGFEKDIDFCFQFDTSTALPILRNEKIEAL